jgi:hypothetical protein
MNKNNIINAKKEILVEEKIKELLKGYITNEVISGFGNNKTGEFEYNIELHNQEVKITFKGSKGIFKDIVISPFPFYSNLINIKITEEIIKDKGVMEKIFLKINEILNILGKEQLK